MMHLGAAPNGDDGPAAAAVYLRERPALDRVLREAARKYVSLGRVGGLVALESDQEAFAVRGLRCRIRKDGRVAVSELDGALRERTRFGCGLVEALEAYLGEALVTRRQAAAAEEEAWSVVLDRLRHLASAPLHRKPETGTSGSLARWLDEDAGYLRAQWRAHGEDFEREIAIAIRAAARLPGRDGREELPVLAFRVAGDAHALDPDRPAGRYFERILLSLHPEPGLAPPLGAEDRETLYALAGLAVDELSSDVLVLGLPGEAGLLRAARQDGHVLTLSLRTLYDVLPAIAAGPLEVLAVENPSIMSALHRALRAAHPPQSWPTIVCTSGHLSLAGLRLLDALVAGGATVRYSGDFDAAGLVIARALTRRYPHALRPWHFDVAAYRAALAASPARAGPEPPPEPGQPAIGAADAPLAELAEQVARHGPAYQEGIVAAITQDVLARAAAHSR